MPFQDKRWAGETKSAPEDRAKAERIRREIDETRNRGTASFQSSQTERATEASGKN